MWRMHPDGSGLERVLRRLDAGQPDRYVFPQGPSQDGTQMLSSVFDPEEGPSFVIHPIGERPDEADQILDFVTGWVAWR